MKQAYVVSYCEWEYDGCHEHFYDRIVNVFTNCQQACDYVEEHNATLKANGEDVSDYGCGFLKRYYTVQPYPLVD